MIKKYTILFAAAYTKRVAVPFFSNNEANPDKPD